MSEHMREIVQLQVDMRKKLIELGIGELKAGNIAHDLMYMFMWSNLCKYSHHTIYKKLKG